MYIYIIDVHTLMLADMHVRGSLASSTAVMWALAVSVTGRPRAQHTMDTRHETQGRLDQLWACLA